MLTAADLPQLQIYVTERYMAEAVSKERSAITGEPSSDPSNPGDSFAQPGFRLSQAEDAGHRECLAVAWKIVPVGPDPASAADFGGAQLPHGIAVIPKDGPESYGVFLPVLATDEHITERNEHFRIELMSANGETVWGRAQPDRDEHGFLRDENPKAAVFTIHDTERDCSKPGEGSGYTLTVRERDGLYWLVIEQPKNFDQCAYVAWRYVDDTLPTEDPDADGFLQGMAYFRSDEYSAALGGYQQWFDLGIPANASTAGQKIRIAWGLGSDRPAISTLTLPQRSKTPA